MCELIEALSRWENEGGALLPAFLEERIRMAESIGEKDRVAPALKPKT